METKGTPLKELKAMTPGRATFDWLTNRYPSYDISPGFLRTYALLGNTGTINMNVVKNNFKGTPPAAAELLANPDAFWCTAVGRYYIQAPNGGTAGAGYDDTLHENEPHPWVNPFIFTGATELPALRTLENGKMAVRVGNVVYYNQIDFWRFKRVGQAQEALEVSTGATNPAYGGDQWDINAGMYGLTPHIQFSGQLKEDIQITLPVSADMSGENSNDNVLCLVWYGFFINEGAGLFVGS